MCTVIILRRPGHDWPLLLAGNRDEMAGRPWLPPGRHWPLSPDVIGGQDSLAEGSWLALNDHGVVATVLNRVGSLGPQTGKRSRGELVLQALDHADAAEAAAALRALRAASYRPFNLLVADNRDAFWLRADGRDIACLALPAGLSMLTAGELNDAADPRIAGFRARFAQSPPTPEDGDYRSWQALLGTRVEQGDRESGLCFQLANGFGTRSAAIIALPAMARTGVEPQFLFAAGPPDVAPFLPVLL